MKVLGLDISTKCGWSLFSDNASNNWQLLEYGLINTSKTTKDYDLPYPFNYNQLVTELVQKITNLISFTTPDVIVIEETNIAKSRYSHKLLEWIHCILIDKLQLIGTGNSTTTLKYVNTSVWRRAVGIELTKEDKRNNAKLSKAKSKAKKTNSKLDKKILGIKGRVNKKHKAVQLVNSLFNLQLKQKDNDKAEAILIGYAYSKPGLTFSDGVINGN